MQGGAADERGFEGAAGAADRENFPSVRLRFDGLLDLPAPASRTAAAAPRRTGGDPDGSPGELTHIETAVAESVGSTGSSSLRPPLHPIPAPPRSPLPSSLHRNGAHDPGRQAAAQSESEGDENDDENDANSAYTAPIMRTRKQLSNDQQKRMARDFLQTFLQIGGGEGCQSYHFVRGPGERETSVDPQWKSAKWPLLHQFFNEHFHCTLSQEMFWNQLQQIGRSKTDHRIDGYGVRPHRIVLCAV
jgi:hypothetical protein